MKALPPDEELLPPEVELEYEKLLLFGRRRCLVRILPARTLRSLLCECRVANHGDLRNHYVRASHRGQLLRPPSRQAERVRERGTQWRRMLSYSFLVGVNKILQIGKRVIVAGPIEGGGRDGVVCIALHGPY